MYNTLNTSISYYYTLIWVNNKKNLFDWQKDGVNENRPIIVYSNSKFERIKIAHYLHKQFMINFEQCGPK